MNGHSFLSKEKDPQLARFYINLYRNNEMWISTFLRHVY
ncbi:hypothetical protein B4155_1462 [Bacillus cereus]|nr:hypothetical protein B4158_0956 [Bacillus cereus]KZD59806.1 hypothetical protein B4118_4445 [Bacillus cereus]KZD79920.1 hypothetical protein B4120_2640 [Bacillus cereus]KZD85918.1 hypothetical protein B4155_1462 [Bacillus cereus]